MQALCVFFIILGKDVFRPKQKGLSQWFSNCGPLTLEGGESSSLFWWFTIAKNKRLFLKFFILILGLPWLRYSTNAERYPRKSIWNQRLPTSAPNLFLKSFSNAGWKIAFGGHGPEMTPWCRAWCGFKSRLKSCFWCHKTNSTANPPVCQNCIHLTTK